MYVYDYSIVISTEKLSIKLLLDLWFLVCFCVFLQVFVCVEMSCIKKP